MKWSGINSDWGWDTEWTGPVVDGKPHGHGEIIYEDLDCGWERWEGRMVDGRREGPWIQKYRNGEWGQIECKDDANLGGKVPPARESGAGRKPRCKEGRPGTCGAGEVDPRLLVAAIAPTHAETDTPCLRSPNI